jgi:hypothetical protein
MRRSATIRGARRSRASTSDPRVGFYRVNEAVRNTDRSAGLGFELGYMCLLGANRNFSIRLGVGATKLFTGEVAPNVRLVNIGWAF